MSRRAGFTFLEVCLAVAIIMLISLAAVPTVRGVLREQRLHRTFEEFDLLASKAQRRSVEERRTYALIWKKGAIELVTMDRGDSTEPPPAPESMTVSDEQELTVDRPAALGPKPDGVWTFWRSGVCEPVIVTYKGPEGSWKARYDALTARGTLVEEDVL